MRDLHSRMLAALLEGDGLRAIADIAAAEIGEPVAIVLPARGMAASSDEALDLSSLSAEVARSIAGSTEVGGVEASVPVSAGDERIGSALAFGASPNGAVRLEVDREEVLRAAALASLTALAVTDARDEVAGELRGSLLEDLRTQNLDAAEVTRRARRMGCDLSRGAVALVGEVPSARPRHASALITGEYPGSIAEALGEADPETGSIRLYAIIPAREGDDRSEAALGATQRISARLRSLGPSAFSSFCEDPADLGRSIAEAELMLDVIGRDERMASTLGEGVGDGVYRLLFRAMASDPEEVRRFYSDTVEPLVEHDREYRTDLLGTLEAYLSNDCNMNATARAVYAHRHTVAHRLNRIRELSGLDPAAGEDRERLGLGIKAFRIIEPTLHR